MEYILTAQGVSKSFEDKIIFDDLDIRLREGQTIALLGPSGIGKTTLMNILSGVMLPDKGQVTLRGEDITGKPGHISYMQQKDLLLPYYTVLYNTALPLIIKGIRKKDAMERARSYFRFFGIEGYENKYPHELSGGMRQRAALLRTYIQSGEVVLLDEPFGALDAVTRSRMQKWYLDISRELGLSSVIITHDTDEALILADSIYVMGDGLRVIDIEDKPYDFELTEKFIRLKKEIVSYL